VAFLHPAQGQILIYQLRLEFRDLYSWFNPEFSTRLNEIVQNEKIGKTVEFFSEGLTKVFTECHWALRTMGFWFLLSTHNKLWAWESIRKALLDFEFYVSATPMVRHGKIGR